MEVDSSFQVINHLNLCRIITIITQVVPILVCHLMDLTTTIIRTITPSWAIAQRRRWIHIFTTTTITVSRIIFTRWRTPRQQQQQQQRRRRRPDRLPRPRLRLDLMAIITCSISEMVPIKRILTTALTTVALLDRMTDSVSATVKIWTWKYLHCLLEPEHFIYHILIGFLYIK